ncbi:MAG: hypothetical protein D6762_07410, partial [Candidatus Neomarinimicrobiota bacterium]
TNCKPNPDSIVSPLPGSRRERFFIPIGFAPLSASGNFSGIGEIGKISFRSCFGPPVGGRFAQHDG